MCGIAGIFDQRSQRSIDPMLLKNMRDTMVHRGPDGADCFIEDGIGLAHRRLAIIDLSGGQQPLSTPDRQVTITFNGEIFNYLGIRKELIAKGHQFLTRSDTETILYAWLEWGEKCVDHLRGMFAFSIWDKRQQTLFCARDRLGVKPFYYTHTTDGFFLFASELKALQIHPSVKTNINPTSIETYFALGYITDPDSIFSDIQKLPAGHTLTLKRGHAPTMKQYWDLPFGDIELDESQSEEALYENLKEAVDIRLMSEVPLGAFLSGGVDSSTVVAIMSNIMKEPVKTCSIGFDDPKYNEADYANQVAQRFQTDHHQKIVSSSDYSLVEKLAGIYDEPFSDSSALPTFKVCELAREQVTVALSGDGADELMSGYRHHRMHLNEEKIRACIPESIRQTVFKPLAKIYPKADWAPRFLRAKSTFEGLSTDGISAYFNSVCQNSNQVRNNLFNDEFTRSLEGFNAVETFRKHAANAPKKDPQSVIQYVDAKTYLIGDILTKVDRASMANSLEVRNPFLDHKWVEWVTSIDNKYKYDGTTGKVLLKKTMENHLPKDILYRAKMGFSVPIARWFKKELRDKMHDSLQGSAIRNSGYFNPQYLKTIEKEHISGIKDHGNLIWSLVMFDGFLNLSSNNTTS
jgi:asparagine synthase (glutamine-hydrolysing)